MGDLKTAFEDVAEWCERHLEGERGREIGMTFGAVLRAYGRLATLPARPPGEERPDRERELNADAEELLFRLAVRFFLARQPVKCQPVEPLSMRTNMTYDPGPRPAE